MQKKAGKILKFQKYICKKEMQKRDAKKRCKKVGGVGWA